MGAHLLKLRAGNQFQHAAAVAKRLAQLAPVALLQGRQEAGRSGRSEGVRGPAAAQTA